MFSFHQYMVWSSASDSGGELGQPASHVDEIVGDDAEPHPAPHAITAAIATTSESVSPLQHADTSLASGALFLPPLEPALLFQFASRRASCAPVGHGNMFHSHGLHIFLLYLGVETGIGGYQLRHST